MRTHRGPALVALLLALGPAGPTLAASAPPEHPWCGTRPGLLEEAIASHEAEARRRARDPEARIAASLAGEAETAQVGNVAIVSDPAILLQPKELDLEGLGIELVPQKKGMRVSRVDGTLDGDLGERVALGDDDTRQFAFAKRFRFPFHKKRYTTFFVNSDGNLTLGAGDGRSVARSLGSFGSLPRIAALYGDLNPVDATGEGGVYVRIDPDRVVVTWLAVPEFFAGTGPAPGPNTFQVTLLKNGTIRFAYGDLSTAAGIVGAGPGTASASLTLVDYSHDPLGAIIGGAVAERFSPELVLDDVSIAKAFYRGFADKYDALVVFLDFPFSLQGGQAVAYQFHAKNEVQGIGLEVFDASAALGSKGKLRSFSQMGHALKYPSNPEALMQRTDSGIDIVAHETGHRWLVFPAFPDPGGDPTVLRGRQRAHWSFLFNSDASHLEGTRLVPRGDGSFEAAAASEGYSEVDLYMMGLLPPSAVPVGKYFYLAGASSDRETPIEIGSVVRGTPIAVEVDQLVAANGPRLPAAGSRNAQKRFDMAFVLVTLPGQGPSPEALARVETYRAFWEGYFPLATEGLGSVSTKLVRRRGKR